MNMNVDATYKLPDGFRTSINVLNRVLNMPSSTIEHELKKHNYSFYSQSSNCIDEKMLDIFAEKFCKNLKRYFERSLQEFETLSLEEGRQFHEFARTYSKHGCFTRKWRDIDKATIKDDFLRQIVELTTREKEELKAALLKYAESVICSRCDESLRVFDATDSFLSNHYNLFWNYDLTSFLYSTKKIESKYDSVSKIISKKQVDFHTRVNLLGQIKQSRRYLSRHPLRKPNNHKFASIIVRIYLSARLFIVPDDGNEDEIKFSYSLRANINLISNLQIRPFYEKEKEKTVA